MYEDPKIEKCMKWLVRSDEVSYLWTLALIHRAIPPGPDSCSTFTVDCITTAKRAIEVHTQCMAGLEAHEYLKTVYVHWYVPLVHNLITLTNHVPLTVIMHPDAGQFFMHPSFPLLCCFVML